MANLKGKHFAICGLFCALLAISSKIQIPTPLIPLTLQTATLFLCILILPNFLSFFTVGIYLITGLIGLPIFAQGGGFSYLLNPTFGYLLGFLFSALIKGIFFKNAIGYKKQIIVCLISLITTHFIGSVYAFFVYNYYLNANLGLFYSFLFSSLIFIPTDLIWCFVCPLISNRILKVIRL